jgi:ketosteroid isomerase-like protein
MRRGLLGVLAALAAAAACASPAQPPARPETSADDLAAINALRSAFTAAVNRDDAAEMTSFYTDDAVRAESNQPPVVGRDAIAAANFDMMSAFDRDIALRSDETEVAGDWAFDRGQYLVHLKARRTGADLVTDQGQYLVILRRLPGGLWKIAREITSSSQAPRPRTGDDAARP